MNMQVLDARRDTSGGYKVDVSRGERSDDSNCVRWCRYLTALSTKWNSGGNFRDASL